MTLNWSTVTLIFTAISWLIPIIMLFIIPTNRKPSSATAWLMLMLLLPYVGLIIFLILGSPKLSKRRRKEQLTMDVQISKAVDETKQHPEFAALLDPPIPNRYEPFVRLIKKLGSLPAFTGNTVELLPNYQEVFKCIAQDIDQAQRFVHVEYYALSCDGDTECVFVAMERAQQRGVKVRVLMDHLGSRKYQHFKKTRKRLEAANIE